MIHPNPAPDVPPGCNGSEQVGRAQENVGWKSQVCRTIPGENFRMPQFIQNKALSIQPGKPKRQTTKDDDHHRNQVTDARTLFLSPLPPFSIFHLPSSIFSPTPSPPRSSAPRCNPS